MQTEKFPEPSRGYRAHDPRPAAGLLPGKCLAECARLGRSRVGRGRDLVEFRCVWSGSVAAAEDGSTPGVKHVRCRQHRHWSVVVPRFVAPHDDEPWVSARGIAAEDAHVFINRLA